MIGGSFSNRQLKTLQGGLSEVILTFSSINDTLKGLEQSVQKHSGFITDLGKSFTTSFTSEPSPPSTPRLCPTTARKHQR